MTVCFFTVSHKGSISPQLPALNFNFITDAVKPYENVANQMVQTYNSISDSCFRLANMMTNFIEVANAWQENIVKIFGTMQWVEQTINSIIQSVQIPGLSEERKEEIRNSHAIWGKYGWTQPPSASVKFLNDPPADQKDAAARILKYCTEKDMEKIFALLLELPHVPNSDVKEAIFDFQHKQYKSCVLILFSLIDACFIRLQRDEDRRKNGCREVGEKAAQKIFDRIQKEQDIHKMTFLLFSYENISQCVYTFFARGNDFKEQPMAINRNFIHHGMLTRKVIREDCVQLFLLYYNLLSF